MNLLAVDTAANNAAKIVRLSSDCQYRKGLLYSMSGLEQLS